MEFHVPGLQCGFCAVAITRGIEAVRGRARVDLGRRTVAVSDNLDTRLARGVIRALGYSVHDAAPVAKVEGEACCVLDGARLT